MEFLRDILEEHLEEADFLYTQRRNALSYDDYDLADLATDELIAKRREGPRRRGGPAAGPPMKR